MNTGDFVHAAGGLHRNGPVANARPKMSDTAAINEKTTGTQHTEDARPPQHKQIESARINEAIAQGIAENVDDFLVSICIRRLSKYASVSHPHRRP